MGSRTACKDRGNKILNNSPAIQKSFRALGEFTPRGVLKPDHDHI